MSKLKWKKSTIADGRTLYTLDFGFPSPLYVLEKYSGQWRFYMMGLLDMDTPKKVKGPVAAKNYAYKETMKLFTKLVKDNLSSKLPAHEAEVIS